MNWLTHAFRTVIASTALMGLATSALAQSPFSIDRVAIDASADTAFEAQRAALEDGQTRAAQILINRLTLPEDRMEADLQPLTPDVAASLIAGLQISDEQRSSTRYRGVLNLDFDPRSVRAYLGGLSVPFVEFQASPIAVVAVTETDSGGRVLGGSWQEAWATGGFENALTPVLAVRPDQVSVEAVLSLNELALQTLMADMGVETLMIAVARQGGSQTRAGGVLISVDEEGALTRAPVTAVAVQGGYAVAAARLVEQRQDQWKRENVVRNLEVAELEVSILFDSLGEWHELQRAVTGASLIQNARLDALSRTGAAMTLTHRGAREQVMAELSARGAMLRDEDDLGWTVRRR